jgi:hypothetical protein
MDLELVRGALEVVDGHTQGDRGSAAQIIEEFENQPATCSACGALTFCGGLEEMEEMDDLP